MKVSEILIRSKLSEAAKKSKKKETNILISGKGEGSMENLQGSLHLKWIYETSRSYLAPILLNILCVTTA